MSSARICLRVSGTPVERLDAFERFADRAAVDLDAWARRLGSVARVLAAVQRVRYVPDPPGSADKICDAATTLREGGDCEDLAALVVGGARALGVPARLVWIAQGGPLDHVVAEVYVEGRWQWAEPTIAGAMLGEHPYEAAARLLAAVPGIGR